MTQSDDFDTFQEPTNIFGSEAPKYWACNIPVIPLMVMQKRPFFQGWQQFCTRMPTDEEQQQWLTLYQKNNIGLPLGPQSGLICVDFDYLDKDVETAVLRVLPPAPWVRVGKKGFVRAYRYNNTSPSKIIDCDGKTVVEILSTGNQVVLPPSIHPETLRPYQANRHLTEVLNEIPLFPADMDARLRVAIQDAFDTKPDKDEHGQEIRRMTLRERGAAGGRFKAAEYVPLGARDVQMTRNAGALVRQILRGDISLKTAMEDMRAWYDMRVEKVAGDELDINKGMSKIIQFMLEDVNSKGKMLPTGWDAGLSDDEREKWGLKFDETQEEWTLQQLVEYIQNAHDTFQKNSPEMQGVESFVLNKLSKSVKLNEIDISKVLHLLKAGTGVTLQKYEKTLRAMKAGPVEGISQTEIAQQVIRDLNDRYSTTEEHG